MEAKVTNTFARWNRIGSAVKDRILIAKTLALSKLWYHSSVLPWSISSLKKIQRATRDYIWKNSVSKVGMGQLLQPKKKRGINMWCMVAKVRAINSTWGMKLENNTMSPDLTKLLRFFLNREFCQPLEVKSAPLMHSGTLSGEWLSRNTGSETLAYLTDNWNRVAYRYPKLEVGDYVYWAHEDGELWPGVGQVTLCDKANHSFKVAFQPFNTHNPRTSRWNCEANSLYKCTEQDWHDSFQGYEDEGTTMIEYGKSGKLISLKSALMPRGRKTSKHGPNFGTVKANKYLYKGQLRSVGAVVDLGAEPKRIRWLDIVSENKLHSAFRANWSSPCSSRVQSFRWLMLNHALPVGHRFTIKEPCPFCSGAETIDHMLYECKYAKAVWHDIKIRWFKLIRKVNATNNDYTVVTVPGQGFWNTVCKARGNTSYLPLWTVVQSLTAYHIWRTRCSLKYNGGTAPPIKKETPFIWKHVYLTLKADLSSLSDIKWWWVKRALRMIPLKREKCLAKVLPPIEKEMEVLNSFLSCLGDKTQDTVEDKDEGASNTVLPYRNRFSNPYWYKALTGFQH